MRILGIDPGIAISGYCILDISCHSKDKYKIVDAGSVQTDKSLVDEHRLLEIHNDFKYIIQTYEPDIVVIEKLFYFKNAKTIVPVCQARGVILLTATMFGIKIYEYTPLEVKQTITGYGRADKNDVKEMIKIILNNECIPKLDDVTDAIAIALCHERMCNLV